MTIDTGSYRKNLKLLQSLIHKQSNWRCVLSDFSLSWTENHFLSFGLIQKGDIGVLKYNINSHWNTPAYYYHLMRRYPLCLSCLRIRVWWRYWTQKQGYQRTIVTIVRDRVMTCGDPLKHCIDRLWHISSSKFCCHCVW